MLTVTATDLPRLMACNGSRLMGGSPPPVNADETVRDEGIAAHWLVEQVAKGAFTAEELIDRKAPNGVYITDEMVEYLEEYLNCVRQGGQVEIDTSHGNALWQINGRADHILYDNGILYINDLKYGWSLAEPEKNWTLISHALGFWFKHEGMKISKVVFRIFQPRPHHAVGRIRDWSVTGEELVRLYDEINGMLCVPSDMLQTGTHCRNCPALAHCPAARAAQYNAIEATEKAFNDSLDNAALSVHLDRLRRASEILEQAQKAYNDVAMHRLQEGQIIDNYALENDLTNRQWQAHVTPELMQILTGKDLTKKKLITPTQVEKAGVSKEVVASLCERRNKGVKLVRMDANARAKKMFNQTKEKEDDC